MVRGTERLREDNMKHYRRFRDAEGRMHTVRMTDEEVHERRVYWAGFVTICIVSATVLTIVSGILG